MPIEARGPVYLDCNATTPIEPEVLDEITRYLKEEYGNAGSRTHEFGLKAKQAVDLAREEIASLVQANREEVFFTSGATESSNLALLGLADYGISSGHTHIVSTALEHKAVLEPLEVLGRRGFEITLVSPNSEGWVEPKDIRAVLRRNTLLVSIIHVNNETGVVQPLRDIAAQLSDHPAFLHTDAAQGFGKEMLQLQEPRIDLISISGHKIYGPKGVGALVARRRGTRRPPLTPLLYGGGQERGLRPGTLPVALIAGLGRASALAAQHHKERAEACLAFRRELLGALEPLGPLVNGAPDRCVPHTINLSFPGLDSEAVMLALKHLVAISNGSACTSESYELSHVLRAMRLPDDRIRSAVRISWSHLTPSVDWTAVVSTLRHLL